MPLTEQQPWTRPRDTFLQAHLGPIAAAGLFTVEALTLTGLVRCFLIFVIDIETRRVQVAGTVHQPMALTARYARRCRG
ncbi:MAG TPA: hypothetical protein VMK12_12925 [Anaeromyxobacteraceae bacterium]|nr:hypothetical protein [Anaeromyxobacteraceae bacterium]